MTVAHPLAATLFLIAFSECGAAAESSEAKKVDTDFGYVSVDVLDVQAAVAEGRAAKEAAREVLLLPNVSFAIVEEGSTDVRWGSSTDGLVTYTWTFPNGSQKQAPRPATYVLRHEIGHDLFVRYLVPNTKNRQYSSDAPDWLDEMAAIAFEGPEEQLSRRQAARMDADEAGLLPLPTLFSMIHPEFGAQRPVLTKNQTFGIGHPASNDTIRFYSTIQVLYDFLVERTGTRAIVAELAAAFIRGEPLEPWILKRVGYGRQGSLEGMNADLLRWLAQDTRYKVDKPSQGRQTSPIQSGLRAHSRLRSVRPPSATAGGV